MECFVCACFSAFFPPFFLQVLIAYLHVNEIHTWCHLIPHAFLFNVFISHYKKWGRKEASIWITFVIFAFLSSSPWWWWYDTKHSSESDGNCTSAKVLCIGNFLLFSPLDDVRIYLFVGILFASKIHLINDTRTIITSSYRIRWCKNPFENGQMGSWYVLQTKNVNCIWKSVLFSISFVASICQFARAWNGMHNTSFFAP